MPLTIIKLTSEFDQGALQFEYLLQCLGPENEKMKANYLKVIYFDKYSGHFTLKKVYN